MDNQNNIPENDKQNNFVAYFPDNANHSADSANNAPNALYLVLELPECQQDKAYQKFVENIKQEMTNHSGDWFQLILCSFFYLIMGIIVIVGCKDSQFLLLIAMTFFYALFFCFMWGPIEKRRNFIKKIINHTILVRQRARREGKPIPSFNYHPEINRQIEIEEYILLNGHEPPKPVIDYSKRIKYALYMFCNTANLWSF